MNFIDLMKKMAELEQPVAEEKVEECGMTPPPQLPEQQDSVTMNVSMTGSGAGGIRDLLDVLKDIDRKEDSEGFGDKDMDVIIKKMGDHEMIDDDFANEPDEVYQSDVSAVTHPAGAAEINGGDHRPRQAGLPSGRPTVESLRPQLESLYNEIKNR